MTCGFCRHKLADHGDRAVTGCSQDAPGTVEMFPKAVKCELGCRSFVSMQYDTKETT